MYQLLRLSSLPVNKLVEAARYARFGLAASHTIVFLSFLAAAQRSHGIQRDLGTVSEHSEMIKTGSPLVRSIGNRGSRQPEGTVSIS